MTCGNFFVDFQTVKSDTAPDSFEPPPDLDPPLADLFFVPGSCPRPRLTKGLRHTTLQTGAPRHIGLIVHAPPTPAREIMPMDLKLLLTVFATVFVAELGDKTQLATLLFAADAEVSKMTVFLGASLALILTSALGVLAGGLVSNIIEPRYLSYIAGVGFILIGAWTLWAA